MERNFQLLYLNVCLCNITIIYNYLTDIEGYKKFLTMREDNNKIILASISCLTINTMSALQCANNKQNSNEVLIYFVLLTFVMVK